MSHCWSFIKNSNLEHKNLLVSHFQDTLNEITNDLDLLDVSNINGRIYMRVFNKICKHECVIRSDRLLKGLFCNNEECLNKAKSIRLLEYNKNRPEIHNEHIRQAYKDKDLLNKISESVKIALNKPEIKEKHLLGISKARTKHAEGIAFWQRIKKSDNEVFLINYLEDHNIKYKYQVPIVTNDLEAIIDFYLIDFAMYININFDSFHKLDLNSKSIKYLTRASHTIQKDEILRNYFKSINKQFIELYDLDSLYMFLDSLNNKFLKEGGYK